jgi:hypothetical protein
MTEHHYVNLILIFWFILYYCYTVNLILIFWFILYYCYTGVHCDLDKSSYNISYLNSPLPLVLYSLSPHSRETICFSIERVQLIWAWWHMLTTPALRRLRQEDWEFESSLGCIMSSMPAWLCNKTLSQKTKNCCH